MKAEKLDRVSLVIIKTITKHPYRKLNLSYVAQQAGVSRPWIYKYMGSTAKAVVLQAIDSLAPMITEVGAHKEQLKTREAWARHFLNSVEKTLIEAEQYPEIYKFYFMTLLQNNEYTHRLQYHESRYLSDRVVPHLMSALRLPEAEAYALAEVLLSMRMGIVLKWLFTAEQTPKARKRILKVIQTRILMRR